MRWGLLGSGSICNQFASDLMHVPGAICAAVASRDGKKAADFAEHHGFQKSFGNYADLLADPDIDVVYIGTPHTEHLANARDAMQAGKHVLCEKPLTSDPEGTRMLIEIQHQTGRYLMEAMWTWFLPAIHQAQSWVAEGRIGELRHIKADFGYPQVYEAKSRMYDPELGGGCLLDMGVYPAALAWLFHKHMPESVQIAAKRAPSGVDDDFSAILEYPSHLATIGSSFRCKLQNNAYIIGRDGYIAIPDFWRASKAILFEFDKQVEHFHDDRTHLGFAYEASAVQQDIERGQTQSQVVSLADSLAIQKIMASIRSGF